jgi:hypothetical protein
MCGTETLPRCLREQLPTISNLVVQCTRLLNEILIERMDRPVVSPLDQHPPAAPPGYPSLTSRVSDTKRSARAVRSSAGRNDALTARRLSSNSCSTLKSQ